MKTKQFFKVIAVLSPVVLTTMFSVSAIADDAISSADQRAREYQELQEFKAELQANSELYGELLDQQAQQRKAEQAQLKQELKEQAQAELAAFNEEEMQNFVMPELQVDFEIAPLEISNIIVDESDQNNSRSPGELSSPIKVDSVQRDVAAEFEFEPVELETEGSDDADMLSEEQLQQENDMLQEGKIQAAIYNQEVNENSSSLDSQVDTRTIANNIVSGNSSLDDNVTKVNVVEHVNKEESSDLERVVTTTNNMQDQMDDSTEDSAMEKEMPETSQATEIVIDEQDTTNNVDLVREMANASEALVSNIPTDSQTKDDSESDMAQEDSAAEMTQEDSEAEMTQEDSEAEMTQEDSEAEMAQEDSEAEMTQEDSEAEMAQDSVESSTSEMVAQEEMNSSDSAKELLSDSEGLLSQAKDVDKDTKKSEISDIEEAIEVAQRELKELMQDDMYTSDDKYKEMLKEAKDNLAEAEIALAEVEDDKEVRSKKYSLADVSCVQREYISESIAAQLEEFRESIVTPMQSSMDMLMQLMFMNMMGANGPIFEPGYSSQGSGNTNYFGQDYGIEMLKLTDLFNAKSMGGINYNVYNVGGNFYGGDFNQGYTYGGYGQSTYTPFGETFDPRTMIQPQMGMQLHAPYAHDFSSSIVDQSRFNQLNGQNMTPTGPLQRNPSFVGPF